MMECPDFEQKYHSRSAIDIYKIGYNSVRLVRWLAYFGRFYYGRKKFFYLMGSVSYILSEIY